MRPLVVVPAFDEAASLGALVAELHALAPAVDVLVVDDASGDATPRLLPALDVAWLRLPVRCGPGVAVRAGLRWARRRGYRLVGRVDGDGQHRPADLGALFAPLHAGEADAVVGSRYLGAAGYRAAGRRRFGQRLLAAGLRAVTGRPVSDPTSGFWAFGPAALALLAEHHPGGYPEPELHLLLAHNRLRVAEAPIAMRERRAGRSSLTARRELAALLRTVLALVVVPLRARLPRPLEVPRSLR